MSLIQRCEFESLKDISVKYDWLTMYVGFSIGSIIQDDITSYAIEFLSENSEDESSDIIELAWGDKRYENDELRSILRRIIVNRRQFDEDDIVFEKRKWLYCVLSKLKNEVHDISELLEIIEEVYFDFDYPEEMEGFVAYMPCTDGYNPEEHTREECLERLYKNFNKYLEMKLEMFR